MKFFQSYLSPLDNQSSATAPKLSDPPNFCGLFQTSTEEIIRKSLFV
jgi:hypothetical protein